MAPGIEEIQQKASVDDFFLVSRLDNPADFGTKNTGKPITVEHMFSDKWLHGGFLEREFADWPVTKVKSGGDLPGLKSKFNDLGVTNVDIVTFNPELYAKETSATGA